MKSRNTGPKRKAKAQKGIELTAVKPEAHKKSDYLEALLVQGLLVVTWLLLTVLFGFAKGDSQISGIALAWCGIGCMMLINAKRL